MHKHVFVILCMCVYVQCINMYQHSQRELHAKYMICGMILIMQYGLGHTSAMDYYSLIQIRIALEDPRHPRNPGSVGQVGTSNKDFGRHHRHEVHDAPVKCASCIAGGTGQIDGLANVKGVPV